MTKEIYKNEEVAPEGFPEAVSMDDVEEGTTYGKVKSENIQNGNIQASGIDGLGGLAELDVVTASQLLDGCVTGQKLAAAAVEWNKIADEAIKANNIWAGGNVITLSAQIKDAIIQTAHIGDLQVTNAKIVNVVANKITAGTGIINSLSVLNTLTMGSATANGTIQSYGWNGIVNGFQILGGASPSMTVIGGTITGAVITGSTLQTGTTGNNVDITQGRISQRYNTNEVVYSDVGTFGGWWGLKNLSGVSQQYMYVQDTSGNIRFKCESGNLYFDLPANKDIVLIGGRSFSPNASTGYYLGLSSNKWETIYRTNEVSCHLPTSNSAIGVIRKLKKPKIEKGKDFHFGNRHYFKIDDFPEEMLFLNDVGKPDIELTRVQGVTLNAVRELVEVTDDLSNRIKILETNK